MAATWNDELLDPPSAGFFMSENGKVRKSAGGPAYGGGSRKGKPNKATAEIRAMIEGALQDAGGQKYLSQQARDNPAAFLSLLGKILPKDVNLGGQPDNPVRIDRIELVALKK